MLIIENINWPQFYSTKAKDIESTPHFRALYFKANGYGWHYKNIL